MGEPLFLFHGDDRVIVFVDDDQSVGFSMSALLAAQKQRRKKKPGAKKKHTGEKEDLLYALQTISPFRKSKKKTILTVAELMKVSPSTIKNRIDGHDITSDQWWDEDIDRTKLEK